MAILCHCHGVSERVIKRSIRHGACTVADVGDACGAGTGCGSCHVWLDEMLDEHARRVVVMGIAAETA